MKNLGCQLAVGDDDNGADARDNAVVQEGNDWNEIGERFPAAGRKADGEIGIGSEEGVNHGTLYGEREWISVVTKVVK